MCCAILEPLTTPQTMVLFEPIVFNLILSKHEVKDAQQPCCVTQDEEAESRHPTLRTSEGPTESLNAVVINSPTKKMANCDRIPSTNIVRAGLPIRK